MQSKKKCHIFYSYPEIIWWLVATIYYTGLTVYLIAQYITQAVWTQIYGAVQSLL